MDGTVARRGRDGAIPSVSAMNTFVETIVIGAGQAGLATAYHLTRHGHECLVLDSNTRVGDNWRQQWDSLRLYSPAKYDGLPGMPFPAGRWHYPSKEETADFVEGYARTFELPVQLESRVLRVSSDGDGFHVETEQGQFEATNVVVATGTFGRTPHVPDLAAELDPAILQVHSSQYRRPEQLPDGPVLVVGASHSGCDIAYELGAERPTVLAGRDCGEIPVPLESRRMHVLMPVLWFVWGHVANRRTPIGRRMIEHVRLHGGPALRVKRRDLAARGVERIEERVVGTWEGKPRLAGGRVLDVAAVVWATGFRQSFDWVDVPVFDEAGWPREVRGAVPEAPGLFFCGLSFQSCFRSMLIGGVGTDAAYVAHRVAERARGLVAA